MFKNVDQSPEKIDDSLLDLISSQAWQTKVNLKGVKRNKIDDAFEDRCKVFKNVWLLSNQNYAYELFWEIKLLNIIKFYTIKIFLFILNKNIKWKY